MVVSSVVKDDILLFRPNPEKTKGHGSLRHSLSFCKYSSKIINMNIYLHCTLILNTIIDLFSFLYKGAFVLIHF